MFRRNSKEKSTSSPVLGWLRRMRGYGMVDAQGNEGVWFYFDEEQDPEFTDYSSSRYQTSDKTAQIQ